MLNPSWYLLKKNFLCFFSWILFATLVVLRLANLLLQHMSGDGQQQNQPDEPGLPAHIDPPEVPQVTYACYIKIFPVLPVGKLLDVLIYS